MAIWILMAFKIIVKKTILEPEPSKNSGIGIRNCSIIMERMYK